MLLLITVSMFRPDFVMNRIYPEYTNFNNDFNEQNEFKEYRKLRLHVTRHTDYGERYKMFAFQIEPSKISINELTGVELAKNDKNNYVLYTMEITSGTIPTEGPG